MAQSSTQQARDSIVITPTMMTLMPLCSDIEWILLVFLVDGATSDLGELLPGYIRIPTGDFLDLFGGRRGARTISNALTRMEKRGWIGRVFPNKRSHRGGYRILAPVGMPEVGSAA